MQQLTTTSVIANQCAHWCGNPYSYSTAPELRNALGYGFPRRSAPRNDTKVRSALPLTVFLCHCEPVRTLVRQSVLLFHRTGITKHPKEMRILRLALLAQNDTEVR